MVADTLSCKEVISYMSALSEVVLDFNDRIKQIIRSKVRYEKYRQQFRDGLN